MLLIISAQSSIKSEASSRSLIAWSSIIKEPAGTDSVEKAYKLPRQVYVVVIKENPPGNVGVGGKLVIDMHKKE